MIGKRKHGVGRLPWWTASAVTASLALIVAGPAGAASVTPVMVEGNPTCGSRLELKLEGANLTNGSHTSGDGRLIITISGYSGPDDDTFSFTVNEATDPTVGGVDQVIVKGGPGANIYSYSPESDGDTNLTTPNSDPAVSHISFCYDTESIPPTNTPVPATETPVPVVATNTPAPTNTRTPSRDRDDDDDDQPTATPAPQPGSQPTSTPVPPTSTPVQGVRPVTGAPATNTPVPPTATSAPRTSTPAATATPLSQAAPITGGSAPTATRVTQVLPVTGRVVPSALPATGAGSDLTGPLAATGGTGLAAFVGYLLRRRG